MKLISMTCPNCGANLKDIDAGNGYFFCQYCGTRIAVEVDKDIAVTANNARTAEANARTAEANERMKTMEEGHTNKAGIYSIMAAIPVFIAGVVLALLLSDSRFGVLLIFMGIMLAMIGVIYIANPSISSKQSQSSQDLKEQMHEQMQQTKEQFKSSNEQMKTQFKDAFKNSKN